MYQLDESPQENGLYTIAFDTYDPRVLRYIVDPAIPVVLLENHSPHDKIEWFEAMVPVTESDMEGPRKQLVRGLTLDVLLPTAQFLERIQEFEAYHGMAFFQLDHNPPDALDLLKVKPRSRGRVYQHFGVRLDFQAPSRLDMAFVASNDVLYCLRSSHDSSDPQSGSTRRTPERTRLHCARQGNRLLQTR